MVSTISTTLPAETVTQTQTDLINVTETTTLVTTIPPVTITEITTDLKTQEIISTLTVSSTHFETSMITETSTAFFTETLPAIVTTVVETITADPVKITETSTEVLKLLKSFYQSHVNVYKY